MLSPSSPSLLLLQRGAEANERTFILKYGRREKEEKGKGDTNQNIFAAASGGIRTLRKPPLRGKQTFSSPGDIKGK